ncbi:ribosome hibernation-promoting factor, HPF/YfiA family [Deinococcus cellulosilyticus]|uniref:Ribosome hibernation promoting factor n=1 Tax=Deinococcus cellulosilyticus (strain DSM 18568 / NBRC 106333 / KACC 11606 / 5516J-15) TaxID=1223518 RepID=A0A511MX17_DEIC1|nr:ribosome-associated translation inhibitor RaiA [Deinococcus cellulosilyticus]GEM45123.1 ribosome hibernation promotion factor [Deinococcus cellulosilyticus NBRC 106333 = KACC 11606]
MNIYKISGRNLEITEALRDYVSSKLDRLDRFNENITEARVVMSTRDSKDTHRRNRIEVQINIPGGIIRAEESNSDMYAAVDRVVDVLERQLRKFKTKLLKRRHETVPADVVPHEEEEFQNPEIVRSKRFEMRPMSPEDAAVQMEALDHDFYVFLNSQTSHVAVVYRRKDGHYGLIEPNV